MLNHIVLMGRLTRDPELRRTGTGIAVASFTLAVDRDYAPKDGGQRETDFIDIVAWRSTAEFVSAPGRTRTAINAAALRWWPTMSTLATASGTRSPAAATTPATATMPAAAMVPETATVPAAILPPPPPAMPLRPARLRRTLPCWRMTMPSSRSKIQPHFPKEF